MTLSLKDSIDDDYNNGSVDGKTVVAGMLDGLQTRSCSEEDFKGKQEHRKASRGNRNTTIGVLAPA